jgi:Flp pilus assembly protein TadD
MMRASTRTGFAVASALAALAASPLPAAASLFHHNRADPAVAASSLVPQIQRALDEQRLVDAGQLLDQATLSEDRDPRLFICAGLLGLARGRYAEALASFKEVEATPGLQGDALEGEGLALSLLERSDEAFAVLQKAVAAKPSAWRAWNALGSEYDARQRWAEADAAYDRAIEVSGRAPIALNNRGFSHMLRGRLDDAVRDFVEALGKKPDLAAARTNLRLAMALRGEYDRAVAGAPQDSEAAVLNNAGFAAMMRGDYPQAESLFQRAMAAKGEFYSRAAANLQLARSMKSRSEAPIKAAGLAP